MNDFDINNIEINNQVKLNELFDGKTWIHGNSKEDINITIFLITIQGHQLKYALEAINKLDLSVPVLVNVIMNISPTNKAYNMMRIRCQTKYFIQLDEDMELFTNAIITIKENLKHKDNQIFLYQFKLRDELLGVGINFKLDAIKLYNQNIMKNYPTFQNGEVSVSSVDRLWHEKIMNDGYAVRDTNILIAYHARKRNGFDIILRFGKNTDMFFNTTIKKRSGDICRFLRPINKLENLDKIYKMLLCHFYNYDKNKYDNNLSILQPILFDRICCLKGDQRNNYGIPYNTKSVPNIKYDFNLRDFVELTYLKINQLQEIYCLIGIINKLFDNYNYSFDKYPYEIYDYFKKIFQIRVCFQSKCPSKKDIIEEMFNDEVYCEFTDDYNNLNNLDSFDLIIDLDKEEINEVLVNKILNCNKKNKCKIIEKNTIENLPKGFFYFVLDDEVETISDIDTNKSIYKLNKILYEENKDLFTLI